MDGIGLDLRVWMHCKLHESLGTIQWVANNWRVPTAQITVYYDFVKRCYIETKKAQMRVKMMAGLKAGMPALSGGVSVVVLVFDPAVVVFGGFGSTMLIPMVEQEIGSLSPGGFTLGTKMSTLMETGVIHMLTHYR